MSDETARISADSFGQTQHGQPATVYTLANDRLRVRITDYGGRMVSIEAPDRSGRRTDVLLGFDDVRTYMQAGGAFGALLGRCANRIAGGRFTLDGSTYQLPTNDGTSTLHGGPAGFDKALWRMSSAVAQPLPTLVLTHVSPDGDQGLPGELSVEAKYCLDGSSLWLALHARTTKPTIVNLSAHPYFNLAGAQYCDALDHILSIAADAFLPTDDKQIPTGQIRPVAGTVFDFRAPTRLGERIRRADAQLLYGSGYDHCFVLGAAPAPSPRLAASAVDPVSGRKLEVFTTQPGLQLYTGNKLNGAVVGRGGAIYRQSAGFAFEAQGFPDAPHHPAFPSTVLRPEEAYRAMIGYRFTVEQREGRS